MGFGDVEGAAFLISLFGLCIGLFRWVSFFVILVLVVVGWFNLFYFQVRGYF